MTLPNKLTITRLFSAPLVFGTWMLAFQMGWATQTLSIVIWLLFIFSEITDVLDGHIARSRGLVSDVGKLMDPFSDVFLRVTYFLCFVASDLMPAWALVIILWREFGIMFIRMLLAREGEALAANKGGKLKSTLYFISGFMGLGVLTLQAWLPDFASMTMVIQLSSVLFMLAAAASLISFIEYYRHFRQSETFKKFIAE
ncbi:MAG: CDP-diacylglycerol--glycerol-3-phosphate 3-phosphatidyltransferase [Spirochaetales bacterium]|nr:CDP-diacylglycerol--glycerol-3-phosphate 3-phosphatidyltransferase [Spirochaetales bacterium]